MARINLLPWREEQRQRKNKEFMTIIFVVCLLAAAGAFATWFFFDQQLADQRAANQLITQENERLDGVLKEIEDLEQRREEIIARMEVIQNLQGRRPIPVRVWDDMARAMPDTLYLTEMKRGDGNGRDANVVTLTGRADNPNVVSNLLRNLDASQWMNESAVKFIEKNEDKLPNKNSNKAVYPESNYVKFEVTTKIVDKVKDDEAKKDGGQADAGGSN